MKALTKNLCLITILIISIGCEKKDSKENKVEVIEKHLDYGLKYELEHGMDELKFSIYLNDKYSSGVFDAMIKNKNLCLASTTDFFELNQMHLKDQVPFIQLQGKVSRYSSRMSEFEFVWAEKEMNEIEYSLDRVKKTIENINNMNSMRTTLFNMYPIEKQLRIVTSNLKIIKAYSDSILRIMPILSKAHSDSMIKKYSNEK